MTIITHVGARVYNYDTYKSGGDFELLYVTTTDEIMTSKKYDTELRSYIVENIQHPNMGFTLTRGFVRDYNIINVIL